MIKPFKNINNIPVIFASDENYAPYLGITLKSATDKFSDDYNYDIIILENNIGDENKKRILKLSKENISIRFFDITKAIKNEDKFYTSKHISTATYYRLFIPEILNEYKKIIYLDIDLLILEDLSKLYNIDIGDNMIAAVLDIPLHAKFINNEFLEYRKCRDYLEQELNIADGNSYFQAGVLVMNLDQMRKNNITRKSIEILNSGKSFVFHDQCILNKLCYGKVCYLPNCWNSYKSNLHISLEHNLQEMYADGITNPKIVHFTGKGSMKAWNGFMNNKWAWIWNCKSLSLENGILLYLKLFLERLKNTLNKEFCRRVRLTCSTMKLIYFS